MLKYINSILFLIIFSYEFTRFLIKIGRFSIIVVTFFLSFSIPLWYKFHIPIYLVIPIYVIITIITLNIYL